MLRKFSVVSK